MSDTIGKIRGRYASDAVGLTQWIARKFKNHDPMSERDGSPGKAVQNKRGHRSVKSHFGDGTVHSVGEVFCGILASDPHKLRYGLKDGRVFEVTLREVEAEEPAVVLVSVGA